MRTLVLLVALSTLVVALPSPAAASATVRLAVFGDTGTTTATQANVNGSVADGATGYVGLGDYYYWSAPSKWKDMFRPLTAGGAYLALGNHDDKAALADLMPEGATWAEDVGGARIVAINTESRMDVGSAQYVEVRGSLCGAESSTRILIMHKPWWLLPGAHHPGTEFPGDPSAMDRMVQECGVDLVLAGHEHNYQRMVRNGVSYAVVGTGGQSEYHLAGVPPGTVATFKGTGRLLVDVSATGLSATFKALDGSVRDTFTAPATGDGTTSPIVEFSPSGGNEWWVQTKATGAPTAVEARDTGGAWTSLTLRSWGAWAGSFRVETGHFVQYRATLANGSVVESCWYAHPAGGCAPQTPVSFRPSSGNEWWVQVNVDGGPMAVASRDTGGAWVDLTFRSWGAWAGGYRVETGHLVQYRATLANGSVVESCWYLHPAGGCAPTIAAEFRNVRGNVWWVESDVAATTGTLAGVDARVNGGAWTPLSKTSWGSWARSMAAPTGSTVELRAKGADGAFAASAAYAWPPR